MKELSEKFWLGLPYQLTMISKIIERPLSELEPLKYICSVEIGEKRLESELTKAKKNNGGAWNR